MSLRLTLRVHRPGCFESQSCANPTWRRGRKSQLREVSKRRYGVCEASARVPLKSKITRILSLPLMGLSLTGLVLSVLAHVSSWMGRVFGGEAIWSLHPAAIAMGVPAVLAGQALTRDFPYRDFWRAAFRGCPDWMRKGVNAFGIYAAVNFILFVFVAPSGGRVVGEPTPPAVIRGFSGHWMFFYAVFFATFCSAHIVSLRDPARRCSNGHPVRPSAIYCERCGALIQDADQLR